VDLDPAQFLIVSILLSSVEIFYVIGDFLHLNCALKLVEKKKVYTKIVTRKLSKSDYSDPSPGGHAIKRYFPRGVAKQRLMLRKF